MYAKQNSFVEDYLKVVRDSGSYNVSDSIKGLYAILLRCMSTAAHPACPLLVLVQCPLNKHT